MASSDGSHPHRRPPSSNGRPQIHGPSINRHFPLPYPTDKPKIPLPDSPLKPIVNNEVHGVGSVKGTTEQDCKNQKKEKSKHNRLMQEALGSIDGVQDASNGCRYDSSLSLLTRKFVTLLHQQEDESLDLNRAADILQVQKRRIYDITNVLEGVGLLEKCQKNRIRWKRDDTFGPMELDKQIAALEAENVTLSIEESIIDRRISEMQDYLRVLKEESENNLLYITKEDINSLPCFQNSTLIAIKVPHGTSIEVPDPDEGLDNSRRQYRILVRSFTGPINSFLVSNCEERLESSNESEHRTPMDLSTDGSCNNGDGASSSHSDDQGTDKTSSLLQERDAQNLSLDPTISDECGVGIMKIVPPDVDVDDDYWFKSDVKCVTDMWN